jgi:hypothetical protein
MPSAELAVSDVKTLYDEDFAAWSKEQAAILRTEARAGLYPETRLKELGRGDRKLGESQLHEPKSQVRRITPSRPDRSTHHARSSSLLKNTVSSIRSWWRAFATTHTEDQILGDWFPCKPTA